MPRFALVLRLLGLALSELFERFAGFLETHADPDITALQVAFFATCFPDPREAAVTFDIITYFGHNSRALLEQLKFGITELEDLVCALSE